MVNPTDIFTALPIVILEPYFVCQFANVIFKGTEIEQKRRKYESLPYYTLAQPNDPDAFGISECQYKTDLQGGHSRFGWIGGLDCDFTDRKNPNQKQVLVKINQEREELLRRVNEEQRFFENKKYIFLLIMGVIGTIVSTIYYNKYKGVSIGSFVGSLFVICYATYVNWNNINEMGKLALSGLALSALMYSGVKYMNKD
jgi:hypothetical protein